MSFLPDEWIPLMKTDEDADGIERFTTLVVDPAQSGTLRYSWTTYDGQTADEARAALLAAGLSERDIEQEFLKARAAWTGGQSR